MTSQARGPEAGPTDDWAGLLGALAILGAGLLLGALGQAWRPPPDHVAGVALLPALGAALGLFARRAHPGWRVRALGTGGLVGLAVLLNALWLPGVHAAGHDAPLGPKPHGLLARTIDHWHPLVSELAIYLAMGEVVAGHDVHFVPSPGLDPRRLLVLARAARVEPIAPPGPWVPAPKVWEERYPNVFVHVDRRRGRDRIVRRHFVGITEGARDAAFFVVLEHDGVTLAIPDRIWAAERRRAGAAGP